MEKTLKRGLSINAKRNIIGYTFVAPALIFFIVFTIVPLIMSLYLSLFNTNIYFINMEYVGAENFRRIFNDTQFWASIINILFYTLMAVPLNISISLILAMLTNTNLKGTKIFRFIYYLPGVTSAVAASTVWLWLMNPSYGLLNKILTSLGLPAGTWLTHSKTALFSVTIVTVWMGVSSNMIIFLAALQNIPAQLYEAAKLDGANRAVTFFRITLPIILPTMYFILTMTLIGA
ncbi:MAG TPA: sugar ABC transporter permease, partial [Clostridia bacterium]